MPDSNPDELLVGPETDIYELMKPLVGYEAFDQWLDALIEVNLFVDPLNDNGDCAIRHEGQRSVIIMLRNMRREIEMTT